MQETKKKWHMPSAFTILFILIILVAILTWFVPAGEYATTKAGNIIAGTFRSRSSSPQGLWDVFEAPIYGMIGDSKTDGAVQVSLYILIIGGFLGVVNKTGTFADGIASAARRYKGRERILIPFLMALFSLGGTIFGMGEETIAFVPILVTIMLSVGYDTITAISISLIGSQIGCMGSTVNPFATGVASDTIHISTGDGLLPRIIYLVLATIIGIIYVMHYADKVKKNPEKSYVFDRYQQNLKEFVTEDETRGIRPLSKKQKRVLTTFILTFVVMIFGLMPWTSLNPKWTFFEDFVKWMNKVPVLGTLVGKDIVPLGSWGFIEITTLILFASILVMFIYRMKEEVFIKAFMDGMREFLDVAMIVVVARGIQVIMNNGYISATILHAGEVGLHGLSSSAFTILAYIFYIPMSFLIPSSSGLAAATMGIIGPIGKFSGVPGSLVVTAYQIASGFVNLVTPTSAIVMGSLAMGHVDIVTWFKYIWKLLLILFIFTCVFLAICTLVK